MPEPVASDISSDDSELREELYYDENEMNLNLDANDFETQSERTELVITKTNKEQRVYVYVGLRWDVLYRQAKTELRWHLIAPKFPYINMELLCKSTRWFRDY